MNLNDLNNEINDARQKYLTMSGVKHNSLDQIKDFENEITTLSADQDILKRVDVALEYLIRELSGSSIDLVEKLVSDGLSTIFGVPYEFKVEVETKRGNLCFNLLLKENGEELDIMDSKGGGVIDLISIFLRILTIKILGLRPILVLDESLSQLSKDHIDAAISFIQEMGEKFGFKVLAVTHNDKIAAAADTVYRVVKQGKYAKVERIK